MTPQSPHEALQPEAPPPPPPKPPSRRRPTLSAISGFLSFLVIAAICGLAGVAYVSSRLGEPGPLQADKVVYIAQHTDLPDIIDKLETEGVIDSPMTLNTVLTVERKRSKVKYGEYLFKAHASLRSVVDTLVSGRQVSHPITIPEGLTSAQIVQRLKDNEFLVGDIRVLPPEGSLLPETYKITRGMTRADLINKMEQDNRKVVEQIWARRSPELPLQSPFELITLASIVEKETGKADERPRVAGVFINRLKRRIRLQSDPTIVYGLVAGQATLGHAITRSDLDKKTPYNTYQIDGLPPGPIDNPGRAALEAVANPSRTQEIYFVADGTGGHVFSSTLEEHNRNVQRWRQIQREAKDKQPDVDRLAPTVTPPSPQRGQRSEASPFGTLPTGIVTTSGNRVAAFADPTANHDITKVAAAEDKLPPPNQRRGAKKPAPRANIAAMSTSLDQMGFSIEGVQQPASSDVLDGPTTPEQPQSGKPPSAMAFAALPTGAQPPASPFKAVRRDGKPMLDAGPKDSHPDLFADPNPSASGPVVPMKTPPEHPKIYDVSEGTALDPLKDKDYDLNSGKTIPAEFVRK